MAKDKGKKAGDKGQSQGSKAGQGRAKGSAKGSAKGQAKAGLGQAEAGLRQAKEQAEAGLGLPCVPLVPGIVRSWEDFSESALREYLAAVVEQISEDLDEQEQAFRGSN